jgi:hypothetical protein
VKDFEPEPLIALIRKVPRYPEVAVRDVDESEAESESPGVTVMVMTIVAESP